MLGLNYIKEFLANLLFRGDRYLLIEALNHYVQVTVLKADFEKKKIRILGNWVSLVAEFSTFNILKEIKFLLKNVRKLHRYKIILSLDSDFATTIYSSISLVRPNSKETIDEADIDNLISQAIWRFFDRHRLKVAQKMNIDDVDVLLGDVRIRGIRLDGHKIVNPIGFKAKAVEIYFSQTFTSRDLMRGFRDLLSKENIALVTEAGTAISHVFSRIAGQDRFFIANLFPNQTSIYFSSSGRLGHLDNFEWGENDLTHLLGRYLKVDPLIAKTIIQSYSAENASENFLRRFENILLKELQMFANGLETLVEKESSDIYVNSFFNLPPLIFSDRFHSRFQKPIKLLPLSTNLIIEKSGFEVQFKHSVSVKNLATILAALLEINFLPQNDKMSHLANRRVRWLVT
ncbi:MAG: hypothetical protein HZB99_02695 [Candidatus Harrisonbacteria bacterium]|nr:hypothetical protein [Candidatus Harrisonbacteria bacterium]